MRVRGTLAPRGVLGMLALVAMIESFIARVDQELFTTSIAQSWRATGQAARREAKNCDILCFGDSAVKFGLSPRLIEAATGRKAYNLAPYGGPPAASYLLLRRALEGGARPSAVIIDAMPHLLAARPAHHLRPWQEIASLRECVDLGWASRDPEFFVALALGRFFASYRDRMEIRENVKFAIRGLAYSGIITYWVTPNRRNWWLNRGGELQAENPKFADDGSTDRPALLPEQWHCDPATVGYLERMLSLCEAHHIAVFWLLPPISPTPQRERVSRGLDRQYDEVARQVLRQHSSVTVIDARASHYDRSAFMDPVHLTRKGNSTLTLEVAGVLRRSPTERSQWMELPDYRAADGDGTLEDLDQSRVAIMQALGARMR
jgi:hypothetical protein